MTLEAALGCDLDQRRSSRRWIRDADAPMATARSATARSRSATAASRGSAPRRDLPPAGAPATRARWPRRVAHAGTHRLPHASGLRAAIAPTSSNSGSPAQRTKTIAKAGGGIVSTVRATRAATEDELVAQGAGRLRHLVAEGVTTVEIKSGYGLDTANELKMLRVARRLADVCAVDVRTTFLGAHALPPEFAARADDYIALVCEEMLPAVASREARRRRRRVLRRHRIHAGADGARIRCCAKHFGLPVKLHADQLSDLGGAGLAARISRALRRSSGIRLA